MAKKSRSRKRREQHKRAAARASGDLPPIKARAQVSAERQQQERSESNDGGKGRAQGIWRRLFRRGAKPSGRQKQLEKAIMDLQTRRKALLLMIAGVLIAVVSPGNHL